MEGTFFKLQWTLGHQVIDAASSAVIQSWHYRRVVITNFKYFKYLSLIFGDEYSSCRVIYFC